MEKRFKQFQFESSDTVAKIIYLGEEREERTHPWRFATFLDVHEKVATDNTKEHIGD